jgi:hypothetical protein
MYKFVVPLNDKAFDYLYEEYAEPESSDISEIIGWVVNDDVDLSNINIKEYKIPKRYQNNIEDFKTDYWDGNFTFENKQKRYIEIN